MKKALTVLSILFIALSVMLLCACDKDDTDSSTPQSTPDSTAQGAKDNHVHTFGEWSVLAEPTCLLEGERAAKCACGEVKYEVIPLVANHSFANGRCTICNEYYIPTGMTFVKVMSGGYSADIGMCTDSKIVIPPIFKGVNVTELGFSHTGVPNEAVTTIVLHKGIVNIEKIAFDSFPNLKEIEVSSDNASYTSVDGVLYDKFGKALMKYPVGREDTEFVVPEGVTEIEHDAFKGASSLTKITVPSTVDYIRETAFAGCTSLKEVLVNEENPFYLSYNGDIYSKDMQTFVYYAQGKNEKTVEINSCVKVIDFNAFADCLSVETIVLPNSVQQIHPGAFSGCAMLKEINIPSSVRAIYEGAFVGCKSLTIKSYSPMWRENGSWNALNSYGTEFIPFEYLG